MRNPRHRGRGSRVAAIMVAIGVLGVVGGSFGLGVFVGLHWSYFSIATETLFARRTPTRGRQIPDETRRTERSEPIPSLTFYQELTAPLSPGGLEGPQTPTRSSGAGEPVARLDSPTRSSDAGEAAARLAAPTLGAPRVSRGAARYSETSLTESLAGASSSPARDEHPAVAESRAAGDGGPFSVQLAAYKTRAQAEALRGALAARGIAAYASETNTPSGPRYRVRVGPFESKEAARESAVSLAADTRLGAFVTRDAGAR